MKLSRITHKLIVKSLMAGGHGRGICSELSWDTGHVGHDVNVRPAGYINLL
jgi:homospermidine synthase